MNSKATLKSLIAVSIIGYVCVLIINYIEGILSSAFKILGIIFNINPKMYFFMDIIPSLLIITFWIILISKHLNSFNGKIDLSNDFSKKIAIKIGIVTLILFVSLLVIRYFERALYVPNMQRYFPDQNLIFTKAIILQILNLIEVGVIAIGFIRIFTRPEDVKLV